MWVCGWCLVAFKMRTGLSRQDWDGSLATQTGGRHCCSSWTDQSQMFIVDKLDQSRQTSVTIWENSCKHAHSKKGQHLPSPEQPLRLFLGNSDFSFDHPGIFLLGDSNLSFSGGPGFPRKSCSFLTRTTLDIRQDDVRHIVTTKNYFVLFCFVSHFDFFPVLIHDDDNCHHRAHQRRWGALLIFLFSITRCTLRLAHFCCT